MKCFSQRWQGTLAVAFLIAAFGGRDAVAQLVYVDAFDGPGGNTTLGDGSTLFADDASGGVTWRQRDDVTFGARGTVFEGVEPSPEIKTTLSGLVPGDTYELFVHFWDPVSDAEDWNVSAGFSSGATSLYSREGASDLSGSMGSVLANTLDYSSPPNAFGPFDGREMLAGAIGTGVANSNGRIDVFVDDLGSPDVNLRTWYDGVSYRQSPAFTLTNSPTAPNGVWSWFEDERAIVDDSDPNNTLLIVSSVSAGGGGESGDIDLLWRNLDTGAQGEFELHDQLEQDDHDSAALYLRPDGRYLAMYSKHITDSLTRWRISTNPHDPTSWGPEQTLSNGAGTTYNNTYYLPEDNGGAGRTYNFTRTANFDPNVQVSDDDGSTWSAAGKLLTEGGGGDRPYLRYASDGKKIHFIATDRHPRDFANSIYHGYIQDGELFNSDGSPIDDDLFDNAAVAPRSLTSVFQNGTEFGGTIMNRAWTISLETDNTGNPVGIFSARANDDAQDHRFFYARYDGAEWKVSEMAEAGGFLYSAERDYTGLASIDPNNPNVVYMSSDIDPRTDSGTANYELYRGVTSDFGQSWSWTAITEDTGADNLRPVVPEWNGQETALVWLQGDYNSYTNWNTEVVGRTYMAAGPKALLWQGDATTPTKWDVGDTINWDSGGAAVDVFNDGDEVAFDDSASSYLVNIESTVSPMGVAFNNAAASYEVTGAGIAGGGRLRVIGGGLVTLANADNTYTGDTTIARGTLAIQGDTRISETPHISVLSGGAFDVSSASSGSYTLTNQTLSIEGSVNGNVVAAGSSHVRLSSANAISGSLTVQSNAQVSGAGRIAENVTLNSNATMRIGDAGLIAQVEQYSYVDATHGFGGNTTEADGSVFVPSSNPDWQIRSPFGNGGIIYQGGSDTANPNEAPVLKTIVSGLTPGARYEVQVNYWTATGSAWRILAGPSEDELTLFDANYTNVSGATDGIDLNQLSYAVSPLTSEDNRTLWGGVLGEWTADSNGEIAVFVDDTGTFDGDDRTWFDGVSVGRIGYDAKTLEVGGDLHMQPGSLVQFDIGDPENYDRLEVGNLFAAGGALQVSLAPDGPIPAAGDTYDLLDFTTATGAFDAISLPALPSGTRWDLNSLYSDGSLSVALVLEGDFNGDGFVDAADYTVWRNNLGANEDGVTVLSGNGNGGVVDASDYLLWRANYGSSIASQSSADIVSVPEAESLTVLIALLFATPLISPTR